ncbi:MAG: FAD-dependent oxidoreductase [Candidatus Bathyarchaeota archaeon]|nr:FAD-dependent oxidoreductase [Candidatus Bathyarchaeota archaeon]
MDETVTTSGLLSKVKNLKAKDARFITITTNDLNEKEVELIYHFEDEKQVSSIRLLAEKGKPIQSITSLYVAAFIAENELQDLFNLSFEDLAVDFEGEMLKPASSPMTLLKPAVGPQPPIFRKPGPCRMECPGSVNIPKYIREIERGDPCAAYNTITKNAPIPAILGRVCFAPCQDGCRQQLETKNIQIRALKRYAADKFAETNGGYKRDIACKPSSGKKVAVVGGGPSGVSAAHYLGYLGHKVTLFERNDYLGGAMAWGIPKYRLPKDLMNMELMARLDEVGAEVKLNTNISSLDGLLTEYDAVYLALGADKCNSLRCEGEDSEGILNFIDFLTAVNVRNETPKLGKHVVVIGGGNSAVDTARTAVRLGAEEVTLYYRRTEDEMPASIHEIQGAMEEGVNFDFLSSQIKIYPGKPLKIYFQSMVPGPPDDSGRRRPVSIEGSGATVEADTIITSIGYYGQVPAEMNIEVNRRGIIMIDENGKTNREKVWAGGDAAYGTSSVIAAIRDARISASAIDKYLGGAGLPDDEPDLGENVPRPINRDELEEMLQVDLPEVDPDTRVQSFIEVEKCFEKCTAIREAGRCWRCDWNE